MYCSHVDCIASKAAYQMLEQREYPHIHRYAGGLQDWEDAGYPLEGEMIGSSASNH